MQVKGIELARGQYWRMTSGDVVEVQDVFPPPTESGVGLAPIISVYHREAHRLLIADPDDFVECLTPLPLVAKDFAFHIAPIEKPLENQQNPWVEACYHPTHTGYVLGWEKHSGLWEKHSGFGLFRYEECWWLACGVRGSPIVWRPLHEETLKELDMLEHYPDEWYKRNGINCTRPDYWDPSFHFRLRSKAHQIILDRELAL